MCVWSSGDIHPLYPYSVRSFSITRISYAQYTAGRQTGTVDELCYHVWQLLEFFPVDTIRRVLDQLQPPVLIRSTSSEDVPMLRSCDLRRVEERAGGLSLQELLPANVQTARRELVSASTATRV